MGLLTDMTQDSRIDLIERKLKKLESRANGGNGMSKLINDLTGRECIINGDGFYEEKCTIMEADEEWVKIVCHERKKDTTKIIRIDSIESFELI